MKTINKVALATVVLFTTLNGLNEVSAIYTGTWSQTWTWTHSWSWTLKDAKIQLKEAIAIKKQARADLIKTNQELRAEAKENRAEFKENRDAVKEEIKTLSTEIQEKLKVLWEAHKKAVEALKATITETSTQAEKDAVAAQIKALNLKHIEDIKALVWDNSKITSFFEAKQALIEENKALTTQAQENRKAFKEANAWTVEKYKLEYFEVLKKIIPKVTDAKLEDIADKIDALIVQIEANTTMDATKKALYLAQYTSIKEILEDEINSRNTISEDINIDELLEITQ